MAGLLQAKNTKISRLQKRMDELKTSSHARNVILIGEKVRNYKLEATLRHFKRHLHQRESTLKNKELTILDLRRKNVTLDNFRFVYDHRVHRLAEERSPVKNHVDGLVAHILAMYDELDKEYHEFQRQGQEMDSKDMKILSLGQENKMLQGMLLEREAYIASFKRELSTIVNLTTTKDVEHGIKDAYHMFVKEEPPPRQARHLRSSTNEADTTQRCRGTIRDSTFRTRGADSRCAVMAEVELEDALTEAHCQRDSVQRAALNLRHRLARARQDARRNEHMKIGKNSF